MGGWATGRSRSTPSTRRGFELAPERFARLERALDAVRADMRATKVTGEVRLVRPDWNPGNVAVESWTGDRGWTAGVSSSQAADDARRRRIGHRRTTSLSALLLFALRPDRDHFLDRLAGDAQFPCEVGL